MPKPTNSDSPPPIQIPSRKANSKTSSEDVAMASRLDFFAERARDMSDASLLEDFGEGLPYLSGACRGFAYDFTEECCGNVSASHQSAGGDTLRMHEKSKPPREEKLFALGWKDNCCFYGNSETYMTPPSLSQRKEAKTIMNHFRGNEGVAGQLACGISSSNCNNDAIALSSDDLEQDSLLFREDLDAFVHHQESSISASSLEEDSYLPRGVLQAVLDLPEMLRTRSVAKPKAKYGGEESRENENHKQVWESLEAQRSKTLDRLVDHTTNYILPPLSSSSWQHKNDRSRWTYGLFGLDRNHADHKRWILECLPVLRRIGVLERSAECLEEQQKAKAVAIALARTAGNGDNTEEAPVSLLRRSTRRATRATPAPRRHHYFDKLSAALRRDEADLDTSAVGILFADQWQSGLVRPGSSRK